MDLLIALLMLFGSIVAGIIANMVANELYDQCHTFACWLIKRAVTQLPERERQRYHEEWIAHLDDQRGQVRKIWHAVGCCYAASALSRIGAKNPCYSFLVITVRGNRYEQVLITRSDKLTITDVRWLLSSIRKSFSHAEYLPRVRIEKRIFPGVPPLDD